MQIHWVSNKMENDNFKVNIEKLGRNRQEYWESLELLCMAYGSYGVVFIGVETLEGRKGLSKVDP